jgi:hypothetical protein
VGIVSNDDGNSFGQPFLFGSHPNGLYGTLAVDSIYFYAFYPVYQGSIFTGTVFDKFSDPSAPPIEIVTFDSLFGDLAIGPTGAKYATFTRNGVRSALFASKDIPTHIQELNSRTYETYSLAASPNPFNISTRLFLELPRQTDVQLSLLNILGQQLYSEQSEQVPAGGYVFRLTVPNLATGVYFVNVRTKERSLILKLLCIK